MFTSSGLRLGAVSVTRLTSSSLAASITGLDREAILNELGRRIQVDRRQIPVERVRVNCVLELKQAVLVLVGGQLDIPFLNAHEKV